MKNHLKLLTIALTICLSPHSGKAFTYAFQDFGGVQYQSSIVTGDTEFAIGYFTGAISVSGATISLANFTNLNTDGTEGGTMWSTLLDLGDPASGNPLETFISVGTAPMDANEGGLEPAVNTPLYVVARSISNPNPFSFAFGNSDWKVKTNQFSDTGGAVYSWGEGFSFANATVFSSNASLATGASGNIVTVVPEPSTGALMMIGAAGLVALRRLRKV